MNKLTKIAMITTLTAALFAGCSNTSKETNMNNESGSEVVTEITEETTETAEESTKEKDSRYPYTYTDEAGREIIFEEEPTKVATSYLPHWETLILLDILPVAATSARHYEATWDALEGYDVSSVIDLGETETNLELLAEVEPDIILEQVMDTASYDIENLEKIAPVAVLGEKVKMDWKHSLREIAKIVNKEEKAEEVIADFEKKLNDARAELGDTVEGKTVMTLSIMGKDRYFIAYRSDLYDKETGLGLNHPEGFTQEASYTQVSMEALVEMNPDILFVNVFDGNESLLEELDSNSVWNSLNAVKNDNVYRIDGSGHAASGLSTIYTVNYIIDTLKSIQ